MQALTWPSRILPSIVLHQQAQACVSTCGMQLRGKATLAYEEIFCAAPTNPSMQQPHAAQHQYQPHAHQRHATTVAHGAGTALSSAHANEPITAMFMHGLLGQGRNWRTFAKKLGEAAAAQTHRSWRMLLVDLRCHGSSGKIASLRPPHNMQSAAEDVIHLIEQKFGGKTPEVVLGHSMGGKVALDLLQQLAAGTSSSHSGSSQGKPPLALPAQTWVLDSQPGLVTAELDAVTGVAKVLETVHTIPLPVPDRQWLLTFLREKGFTEGLTQWLASNLVHDHTGRFTWAFNAQGASAMYHSYRSTQYWHVLERPPAGTELHLVRGDRSDRWLDGEGLNRLAASAPAAAAAGCGMFKLHTLPKAGHWLHVDNPSGLMQMILQEITRPVVVK